MDDDDTPVIRPVLPSRASGPPAPMWQEAGAVANERQSQDLQRFPLSPKPERTKPVTQPKKDPRRSAAAREAWKRRRKNVTERPIRKHPALAAPYKGGHNVGYDELGVLIKIGELLEPLPAAKRKAVLTILQGLMS